MAEVYTPTGFSDTIFRERYALTKDETWEECCHRVAKQMALAEQPDKMKFYEDKFTDVLQTNVFVPGGRIWRNSGRNKPQLLNCFVLRNELDSKEGWGAVANEMIVTSMTGGGCGINFSDIRPNNSPIKNGGTCPGPVMAMQMIDNCAEPVRCGGGRRVALMFELDLQHPDVEEFLNAKLVKGKLTNANVSVWSRNTTAFIKAVENDEEIELSWKGQYKKKISAKQLWNTIVTNAYDCAEPGFLNAELAENESNIWYIEKLASTNPCGEIFLSPYDCCCLGHLVLFRFVKNSQIDWHELAETVRLGTRFLDNVLTVNQYPMDEMKQKSHKLRRIGLGVTGMADMLALLNLRYGSFEANEFLDKLFRFISKQAYEAGVMLAIEKGPFPAFDAEKHLESGYMKRMPKKIRSLVAEHGLRNCAYLTIAPTGTVSILSDNCSSGIEPMFAPAYKRNYFINDVRHQELVFHPLFHKFMEDGRAVEHFVGSRDISVRDHMEVQKVIQAHIDNAVSKTINIPADYPMEEVSKLWLEYLPFLKGTTFFRENTRGYVDPNTGEIKEPPLVALSLEDAKNEFFSDGDRLMKVTEHVCKSGLCEI